MVRHHKTNNKTDWPLAELGLFPRRPWHSVGDGEPDACFEVQRSSTISFKVKHDVKDARTIGLLVKDRRFSYLRILQSHEADLWTESNLRVSLTEDLETSTTKK
ncbi:hypothetical protein CHH52_01770 [Shouchella clausii]|nr:hypothetical protein CHH52_01770 [Shouchella clausii]